MIRLRKIEPADLPFLYRWENDADAWSDGSNHNPLSQKDLRDYIQASTGDIYKDGQLRLVIECSLSEDDTQTTTIGCVDLFDLDPRNARAAVGVYIAPDYRDRGWGSKVLDELARYAFGFLHLRTLYAVVSQTNKPSCAIFQKSQYIPSGQLTQWTLDGDAILFIRNNENRI